MAMSRNECKQLELAALQPIGVEVRQMVQSSIMCGTWFKSAQSKAIQNKLYLSRKERKSDIIIRL
jgi:hypothetical protein